MITKKIVIIITLIVVLTFSNFIMYSNTILNEDSSKEENPIPPEQNNLLQYEWPQHQGDSSFTRFSAGPGPDAPDVLWKADVPGIQSYLSAFNGMVFAANNTTVFALHHESGELIWKTAVPEPGRWPATYKIDEKHMVVGSSCLEVSTGKVVWTSNEFSASPATFSAGAYSPEEKMFFTTKNSNVQGWNFTEPQNPPILEWETYVIGLGPSGSGVQYGGGKVFPGTYMPNQIAIDSKSGEILWTTETKGSMLFSGSYYEGKFFKPGTHDNTLYCFDSETGKIIWEFNPKTYAGYWCTGPAVAYDMVFQLNKDGHLYALDTNTGNLIWKYKGPGPLFFPGHPTVADGKIYATTGQQSATHFDTGERSESEFVCVDAYTGQVIWKLPIEAHPPRESAIVAYGNLYIIPGYIEYDAMDRYTTFDQVWAFGSRPWAMWRRDQINSGSGQSGPNELNLRWKFSTNGAIISSPSASYGKIFFGSYDKNIYAVDAYNGELSWKFLTNSSVLSSPAVVNGKVYVGPDDGTIYCLDAFTGDLIWSQPVAEKTEVIHYANIILRSSPAIVDGLVYVGSMNNRTYCLDAETGSIKWEVKTNGYIASSPVVYEGTVFVLSQEPTTGVLYALNATTGDQIRKTEISYQQPARGKDLMSSPTIGDGMIFVASNKMAHYGVDIQTGKILWENINELAGQFIISSPIYNDGKLYIVDMFFVVCLDATNGTTLWRKFLGSEFYVSPTYADGKLYVISDERILFILNATNGEQIAHFETSSNSWSAPILYEGMLFVGNNDWNVYCFEERSPLKSNIELEIDTAQISKGSLITGSGEICPRIPNTTIRINFLDPNNDREIIEVETENRGKFSFNFEPKIEGIWTINANWISNKLYYTSANSEYIHFQVKPTPTTPPISPTPPNDTSPYPTLPTPSNNDTFGGIPIFYVYMGLIGILFAVIVGLGYIYKKRVKNM